MSDTYNGWANRETWALCLWIDNDQGFYEGVLAALRESDGYGALTPHTAARIVREYAEGLLTVDGYHDTTGEDHLPASLSRIAEDIGSLYRVDWDAVGAHYLTALAEEES